MSFAQIAAISLALGVPATLWIIAALCQWADRKLARHYRKACRSYPAKGFRDYHHSVSVRGNAR